MKYFTPLLFQQFNSPDDAVANRADAAWDEAELAYKHHLETFRDRLPSQVRALSEVCLHDAEILSRTEAFQPAYLELPFALHGPHSGSSSGESSFPLPFWSALGIVSVEQGGQAISLIYGLTDNIRECLAPEDWKFSKAKEHWLYDEIDWSGERPIPHFFHRILLSTGVVLEIPFASVFIHKFALPATGGGLTKRTA